MSEVTEEPVLDPGLAKVAEQAHKAMDKSQDLISRITTKLRDPELRERIRKFAVPPRYEELVSDSFMIDVFPYLAEIVEYYRDGEALPGKIDDDTLRLGALLFYFAGKVNHLETLAADAEGVYNQAYERTLLAVKVVADENKERVTKEVCEALASTEVEDLRSHHIIVKMLAHTMKGFYYAGKDLLEVMNSVGMRLYKSNMDTKRGN